MSTAQEEPRTQEPDERPAEKKVRPWSEWINRHGMLFAGTAAMFAVLLVVQSVRLANQRSQHQSEVASMVTAHAKDQDLIRSSASFCIARTLGASLHQLFVMRSQFPEISDRTFQAVAAEMASTGDFQLVVIADGSGRVIASSDLTLVGTIMEQAARTDSPLIATSLIREADASLGSVKVELHRDALAGGGR